MPKHRFLDPFARQRSFAARAGGMRDDGSDARRLRRIERQLNASPDDESGEIPDDWSMMEEVNAQPTPTADVVGRMFLQRNASTDDVLSVGITAADGTPVLVGLTTQSPDGEAVALEVEAALVSPDGPFTGVAIMANGDVLVAFGRGATGANGWHVGRLNASLIFQGSFNSVSTTNGDYSGHVTTDGTYIYVPWAIGPGSGRFHRRATSDMSSGAINYGTPGSAAGQLTRPTGIAASATHIFITDRTRNKVLKYTLAGVFVSEFGSTGSAQGQFSGPTGIALDTAGNIYVCDTGNNRIQKFDSAGTWLATFGGVAGNADGQLNAAEDVAVDAAGNLWIADTGNHRVQVLDATGAYVAKIGSYGSGTSNLNSPNGIALGDGYGYVVDSGNKRLSRVKVAAEHTHTPIITVRQLSDNVAAGGYKDLTVNCLADEFCTGGGFSSNTSGNQQYYNSRPNGTTGWTASCKNEFTSTAAFTVMAVCMKKSLT